MTPVTQKTSTEPHVASSFIWTRLGSFLAIAPLGIWTVIHLWDNLAALRGPEAWQRAVTEYPHAFGQGLTLVVVLLPLVLHSLWGLQRLFSFRPNNARYPNYGNLKYLLQRISAVGALFFIGAHTWLALLQPRLLEGRAEPFSDIASEMRFHLPTLVVYLLGTLGVAYHLANGLSSFAWTWGLAAGRRSIKRLDWIAIGFFLVLLAMSWTVIFALYQAGGQYPPAAGER